jgi:asparagine synthase (glutamine-hydrolysing)
LSGIVGIVNRNGRLADQDLLRAMAATVRHRGPDGEGTFSAGAVGLGQTRLAVIDLAGGEQPMREGGLTIVLNGTIYNYRELRTELNGKGHVFRTQSDVEVALKAYAEWGLGALPRFNGSFAFLLHDAGRRELVVARDHIGVKPLYYYADRSHWLFGSEIKALLVHPAVRAAPDSTGLRDYLTFQYTLGSGTLFEGIRKVLPGHAHVFALAGDRERVERYWTPHFFADSSRSDDDFLEELGALVADSVRLRLRADVPVGTFLSGGLDSSLITILAARELGTTNAFTARFSEGAAFDESAYAREVASDCGATLHEVVPDECDFARLLPELVYHMDEPAAGPGLFPQFIVARLAAQHAKVVLSGHGGDEVFGGYARYLVAYFEQALKGAIYETTEERDHIVTLASIIPNLPTLQQYVPMLKQFWRQGMFDPMDRRYFALLDRSGNALSAYTPDFRAQYGRDEIFERFRAAFNHSETRSYYSKMTRFDLMNGLPALLQVEDRASTAASIESRMPLLDHRVVDLVNRMPPRLKFQGGELKSALKRVARGIVPARVLDRKDKMGFPVPLHLWARGRSRDFIRDTLLSDRSRARGIFDVREVARMMDYEPAFGRRLWGMLNLELWFRTFIDAA